MNLILASSSPRRQELLRQIGLQFRVVPSEIDENLPLCDAANLVTALARSKAGDVAARFPEALVLGADTVVSVDGAILGKPSGPDEAVDMLGRLSGRAHDVYTGLALVHAASGRSAVGHEHTVVRFRKLTDTEIAGYVKSGEPLDKAGAYGIQGRAAVFVSCIEGCYFNVVGLPLSRLWLMLHQFDRVGLP